MKDNLVSVCLWGSEVGKLYWDERRGVSVFQFSPGFVEAGVDLSPIECPMSSATIAMRLPIEGVKDRLYQGLPAFICDSLPDRWGNEVFAAWCVQHGIALHDITPVDRLSFMGKRAMGALEFLPSYDIEAHPGIELSTLYRQADEILRRRGSYAIAPGEQVSLDALYMVGTSAGGQQAKAVIAIDRDTGEIRSGQTVLPDTYDYYILKFNNEEKGFPRAQMEMVYHDMAVDCGIEMMDSRLLTVDGKPHFLTRRYDRCGQEKIHTQTAFSMYTRTADYDDLFYIGRCLKLTAEEQRQQFVRLVFNVLACNCDDHSKNFSYMLRRGGKWQLAPAYDLNFVAEASMGASVLYHQLAVGGQSVNLDRTSLLRCAERNDIRHADGVIESVAGVVARFPEYARRYDIDQRVVDRVGQVLYSTPFFEDCHTETPALIQIEDAQILRNRRGWVISIKVDGWWHDRLLSPKDASLCEETDRRGLKDLALRIAPDYLSADMRKP